MSPSENPALLTLLDGRPALWALIAVWPSVPRPEPVEKEEPRVPFRVWASMAGVAEFEARAWSALLFGNGFLTRAGDVDPLARQYVQAMVVDALPTRVRDRMTGGKKP